MARRSCSSALEKLLVLLGQPGLRPVALRRVDPGNLLRRGSRLFETAAQKAGRLQVILKQVALRFQVARVQLRGSLKMLPRLGGVARSRKQAGSLRPPPVRAPQPEVELGVARLGGHRFFQGFVAFLKSPCM